MKQPNNPAYAMNHIDWDRKHNPSGDDEELLEDDSSRDNTETAETYSHPDVSTSAEWLAEALKSHQIEADFSLESLAALDRFLAASISAQLPGSRDFLSDDLSFRAFAIGAYVGEVIRREKGGEWTSDPSDPLVEINIALAFEDGSECFPMKRVFERLNNGPASSLTSFAVELGLTPAIAPGEPVESTPKSPEDFNVRGFVMLWNNPSPGLGEAEFHFAADTTACVNLLGYFTFLESRTIPSLKSISALTAEEGVVLPESHADGTTRAQMGIFYDPDMSPDYWRLVDDNNQLYIEMGRSRLLEFKNAVTTIFLGHDTPLIGGPDQLIQLWPKAKTEDPEDDESEPAQDSETPAE
jgi:hypothetical protein